MGLGWPLPAVFTSQVPSCHEFGEAAESALTFSWASADCR